MPNIFYIILSLALLFCLVVLTRLYLSSKNRPKNNFFLLLCGALMVWVCVIISLYFISDAQIRKQVFLIKYVGISFSTVFCFLFIKAQLSSGRVLKSRIYLVYIIPIITSFLAIFNNKFYLIYKELSFDDSGINFIVNTSYGPWFYLHLVYSYLFVLLALFITLKTYFLVPKQFRQPVVFMLTGLMISIVANMIAVFFNFSMHYDITVIISVISAALYYSAINFTPAANLIMTSKDYIFENLGNIIIVVDAGGKMLAWNSKAGQVAKRIGIQPFNMLYEDAYNRFLSHSGATISHNDNNIISVEQGNKEDHYRISKTDIISQDGNDKVGFFVEISKISEIFTLFRYLEQTAHYDQLTGIFNRNAYIKRLEIIASEENLPLGVFMADVNSLKKINDTLGHLAGDKLLIKVADIIKTCCPEKAFFARLGGDEFTILLPNATHEECSDLVNTITNSCDRYYDPDYGIPSVSFGFEIMQNLSESISDISHRADIKMYANKKDRRAKN